MRPEAERNYWFTYACRSVLMDYEDMYCPVDCGKEKKCKPYDYDKANSFPPKVLKELKPSSIRQTFNTNYMFEGCGVSVPLVKTVRSFSAEWSREFPYPKTLIREGEMYYYCGERNPAKYQASMKEHCVTEQSTLHYVDLVNKVLLYKYKKEFVDFDITSTKIATFYPGGNKAMVYPYHKLLYPLKSEADATYNGLEEWRLVIDGAEQTLTSEQYKKAVMPWGGPQVFEGDNGVPYEPCAVPPSDRYSVFILPVGMSTDLLRLHDPANNQELYCNGWYDITGPTNEEDMSSGWFKDFFYPSWCRGLLLDPFWQYAAGRRSNDGYATSEYVPPPISVDPIPRGDYVKHPILGEIYQFLVEKRDGGHYIKTSKDLRDLVNSKLPESLRSDADMLYYPLSLV